MAKFLLLGVLLTGLMAGCSSAPPEDPAPAGPPPEIKTVEPGMQSPEQRARTGGGEGS